MKKYLVLVLLAVLACSYSGCGSSEGYKIGGTVLGLDEGETIALQMNLQNDLEVNSNTTFTFSVPIPDKTFYDVIILTAPAGKTCSIANNEGYTSGADITNVDVICSTDTYTVGGTVVGLDLGSSLVLQNNLDDDLTVTSNGSFTFHTALADRSNYDVTILTNKSGKTCGITNSKDIIMGADVTNVVIVCNTNSYSVGGTVTGIPAGKELLIQNNSQNTTTLTDDGDFTFTTKIPNTGGYNVTILKEPKGTNCTVANGSGTIGGANITDVEITCVATPALIMFLSSYNVPSGYLGGTLGADVYCQRDPQCPIFGKCKALIVDGATRVACTSADCSGGTSEHVDWALQANRTYVMTDKTTVIGTTTDDGIFAFPLTNAISSYNKYVWTGLYADWTTGRSCYGWWTKSSSKSGSLGLAKYTDDLAIYSSSATDSTSCRYSKGYLYCVEQPD